MRSFRTFLSVFAVVALAACGGGSGGTLPSSASGSGTADPLGSSVAFEKATLWVAYDVGMNAFAATGTAAGTLEAKLGTVWSTDPDIPGNVDIAVAPDGTRWVLQNHSFATGGLGWHLYAVAPGDSQPENTESDSATYPFALGLGGKGVMVGYRDTSGTTTIATYPYGASNAAPIRTFHTTGTVFGFAEGNDGYFYVARPNGVDVYRPKSDGCCPVRSIVIPTAPGHVTIGGQEFAIGPDGSIYLVDLPGSQANPVMYVNVYANAGTLARRIGPLPANYNGLGFPVITVDSKNRLFVATNGQLYRFAPAANGTDAPQGVITDPTLARPRALAVGPPL